MKLLKVVKATTSALGLVVEAGLWAGHLTAGAVAVGSDAFRAYRRRQGAIVRCPRGHETNTEGTFECAACAFVYEGSAWFCENIECPAPITVHLPCTTCGLSIRNPWRLGHP